MITEYRLRKEVSIGIGDPGNQSKTSLRRLVIFPPVIGSACAGMMPENRDVAQEKERSIMCHVADLPAVPLTGYLVDWILVVLF